MNHNNSEEKRMTNRLETLFNSNQPNLLNVYFTAGYPCLDSTVPIIRNLASSGADLIEIGMPYSDPMADGQTIQQSSARALKNGMTLDVLFTQIRQARKHTQIPLVLMGYYNQVLQYGQEKFVKMAAEAGVDGLILPDLPLREYQEQFASLAAAADLQVSFLVTPQTSEKRIREIDAISTGFLYVVSSSSITGKQGDITDEQRKYFDHIEQMKLTKPRLIGFGISDSKSFHAACQYAHGAIIGSAFIRALPENGVDLPEAIHQFIYSVRAHA